MKRVLLCSILLIALAAGIFVSPYGLAEAQERVLASQAEEQRLAQYQNKLSTANSAIVSSVTAFNEQRAFDIYYGDVTRLQEVLLGIGGIEIQATTVVDPMDGWRDVKLYGAEDTPRAIRFDMLVEDVPTTLSVLERMELPISSIAVKYPSQLNVTFLTGGEV